MQEVLWLILHDGDIEGARKKQVYFRSPFLEFKDEILNEVGIELANPMSSPRIIKSHLQVHMMPKEINQTDSKIIIVLRNPKDLCVSYYNFYRSSSSVGNFKGTWSEFLEMFKDGYVDHGSWVDFTRSWWGQRDNPNVKIVYYEDMKKESDLSDETVCKITDHCSFDSMRSNPMTNHHDVYSINKDISPLLRKEAIAQSISPKANGILLIDELNTANFYIIKEQKLLNMLVKEITPLTGTVGDWKNTFTVTQNEDFDVYIQDKIGDLEIPFKYEI
ncbi:hypothetical protein KUTeg_012068 [Tegillarca granosa]|uniref:Sulfotransferase domain-containing protein n=1 Tax=Tegillarca granosa TaxID=220873 RepID=A0ABQ9EYH9_TEGGR|nr:hypothetical protein KUTeg_012068 [Tegillarca granosa]